MSFALYTIGYVIFTIGVALALAKVGLDTTWVAIICLILVGIGIARGVTHTRSKDPSS
jgi:uncharacterized membrane protein